MKKQNKPIKLTVTNGEEAWAYIDEKSIEIYMRVEGECIRSARLTEKQIKKFL